MIISDLNHLEVVSEANNVQGGTRPSGRGFTQVDSVTTTFDTTNRFTTIINPPRDVHNVSAAAGAKGVADVGNRYAYSYTKADTLAVVDYNGNSFSSSSSAALISF
ncbi:hypothetical protein [Thermocoleostomius sinensis]|uniref:Uncharacterized protein n=1 Tax=Thermocoleostomius sinensis A174 TaxID=2016057 RepID=A0A9E8ZC32_9CYAN|nr:hypothetical protein [Thermocoleostomius sinensis]WAL60504.1 hypothetical protein OXH18_00480 [Thermocoleostomius sinensis A174]